MHYIGKKISPFTVQAFHRGDFKTITEERLDGMWSVFVFYPADFTFVCPTELGDLADIYSDFLKIGCEVYAVSTDTHFTHKAWCDVSETIQRVTYPMLADPTHTLCKDFGVLIESEGQALRGTFIVDPQREIVAYEVHSPGIGRNVRETLRTVQAAQFVSNSDEVCPAGWIPGKPTISPSIDLVGKI